MLLLSLLTWKLFFLLLLLELSFSLLMKHRSGNKAVMDFALIGVVQEDKGAGKMGPRYQVAGAESWPPKVNNSF